MGITGRNIGFDSIICGQKMKVKGMTDSLRPCWHHTVRNGCILGTVSVCKSVKHFLPLYKAGNKGHPCQTVACTPTITTIHRLL